jgi:CRISPR/Cas system CSM-associated protein Csm2 small subunit
MATPAQQKNKTKTASKQAGKLTPQKPAKNKGPKSVSQHRQDRVVAPQGEATTSAVTGSLDEGEIKTQSTELHNAKERILELERALAAETARNATETEGIKHILDNVCAAVLLRTYSSDQEKYDRVVPVLTKMKTQLAKAVQENAALHRELSAQSTELKVMSSMVEMSDFDDDADVGLDSGSISELAAATAFPGNLASGTVKIDARYFRVMMTPHKDDASVGLVMGYDSETAAEVGEVQVNLLEFGIEDTNAVNREEVLMSLQGRLRIAVRDGQEVFELAAECSAENSEKTPSPTGNERSMVVAEPT